MNTSELVELITQSQGASSGDGQDDPRSLLLAELLKQSSEPEQVEQPQRLHDEDNHRKVRVDRIQHRIIEMQAELRELRRRNAATAAATGACPNCWGEDSGCVICGGDGGPGAAAPDPIHYRQLIQPALDRMTTITSLREGAEEKGERPVTVPIEPMEESR